MGQLCTGLCPHSPRHRMRGNDSCSPKAWQDPHSCLTTSEDLRAAENWNSIHPPSQSSSQQTPDGGVKGGFFKHFRP